MNNKENAIPRGARNHDKLFKVHPLLEAVNKAFLDEYLPWRDISVHQAMVKFKGKLSLKQYMPMKPIKQGIKIWECCDSSNSYACNLQIYTGKQDGGNVEHVLGYRVVRELTQPFIGKNHHVYCENYFSSIDLVN